jgi:hypothetical protein
VAFILFFLPFVAWASHDQPIAILVARGLLGNSLIEAFRYSHPFLSRLAVQAEVEDQVMG